MLRYPTKVIMWGGVPDVVNHVKFHQNRFRDFGPLRSRNLPFPMLSAMAYITGEGYRASPETHINILL